MIMTADKARKIAARQRMAETGEPYSVARHAVEDEHATPAGPPEGVAVDRRGPSLRAGRAGSSPGRAGPYPGRTRGRGR